MLFSKISLNPRKVALLACAVSAVTIGQSKAEVGYADWVTVNQLATSLVKGEIRAMDVPVQGFMRGGQHWPKGWWTPNNYGFAAPTIPAFTRVRALYSHEFTADKSCPQGYMAVQIVDTENRFKDIPADQLPVAVLCSGNLGRIAHLEHIARKVSHACYSQGLNYKQMGFKYSRTSKSKSRVNHRVLMAPMQTSPVYTVGPDGTALMVTTPGVQYWNAWAGLSRLKPTTVVAKFADYSVQYPCPVAMVMGIPQGRYHTGAYSFQIMETSERLPLDFKERFQVSTVDMRPLVHGWWGSDNWAWNHKASWQNQKFAYPYQGVDVSKLPYFEPMERMLAKNYLGVHGNWGRPYGGSFVVTASRGLKLQSNATTRSRVLGALHYREPVVGSAVVPGPGCAAGWMMVSSTTRPGHSGFVCAKHLAPTWGQGAWGNTGAWNNGWQGNTMMNLGPDEIRMLLMREGMMGVGDLHKKMEEKAAPAPSPAVQVSPAPPLAPVSP